jgi:hypothetical protein
MTTSDLAELKSLLSGYFHEDWELEASEPDEVIFRFLESGPSASEIDRIVAQIRHYLGGGKDDTTVERGLLKDLGCYYLPSADGISASDWLRHVADRLSQG